MLQQRKRNAIPLGSAGSRSQCGFRANLFSRFPCRELSAHRSGIEVLSARLELESRADALHVELTFHGVGCDLVTGPAGRHEPSIDDTLSRPCCVPLSKVPVFERGAPLSASKPLSTRTPDPL